MASSSPTCAARPYDVLVCLCVARNILAAAVATDAASGLSAALTCACRLISDGCGRLPARLRRVHECTSNAVASSIDPDGSYGASVCVLICLVLCAHLTQGRLVMYITGGGGSGN